MRRSTVCIALLALGLAPASWALYDPPHGTDCQACHTGHAQPTGAPATASGNANLCLSCHSPAGLAAAMPMSHLDRADPFTEHTGSSHSWQVGAERAEAGALAPEIAAVAGRLHDGQVVCSTCHDQHSQDFPPFLRADNAGDAMCLDCHRSRALGRWADSPGTNIGSHPIGISIPDDDTHRTPGDGETHLPLQGGEVLCTTCHAVHFAPSTQSVRHHSTSGTTQSVTVSGAGWPLDTFAGWEVLFPDGGSNERERRFVAGNTSETLTWAEPLPAAPQSGETLVLLEPGDGDGNLLRGANDSALCQRCHDLPDHPPHAGSFSCRDCHTPHGTGNILLVAPEIAGTAVQFTGRTGADFVHGAPNYDGICEVCHTQTNHHRNSAVGDHSHNVGSVCTDCHEHVNSFAPSVGACGSCHDVTPATLATGSHASHFTALSGPRIGDCASCHGAGADTATHAGHLNGTVNFAEGAETALAQTAICNTCHSPGGFFDGVAEAKTAWSTGVHSAPGTLSPAHAQWCAGCHDDDPSTTGVNESSLIGGVHAPPMMGDNATYGHYVTGHGRTGSTYTGMSWQAAGAVGNPAAALECDTCHDPAASHIDGAVGSTVRLRPGFESDQSNTGCVICHAPGGVAAHAPGYFTSSGDFEASAHGGRLCTDCHNPHGTAGSHPAMAIANEESLCLPCHTSTQGEFGLASHHDIGTADQIAHGSRVECTMCHNPHLATASRPLIDPDSVTSTWTDASPRDFCLACHDGNPPAAVSLPAISPGSGWDQSDFVGSRHDVTLGGDCTLCHSAHGSANRSTLLGNYSIANYTTLTASAYEICFTCHDLNQTIYQRNAFNEYHQKHVQEERAPCIECHNPHGAYDAAEDGLIDFEFPVSHGYYTLRSGRTLSTSFIDTGANRGQCYLTCHGEGHNPESYTGTTVSTVNCLMCHTTNP